MSDATKKLIETAIAAAPLGCTPAEVMGIFEAAIAAQPAPRPELAFHTLANGTIGVEICPPRDYHVFRWLIAIQGDYNSRIEDLLVAKRMGGGS